SAPEGQPKAPEPQSRSANDQLFVDWETMESADEVLTDCLCLDVGAAPSVSLALPAADHGSASAAGESPAGPPPGGPGTEAARDGAAASESARDSEELFLAASVAGGPVRGFVGSEASPRVPVAADLLVLSGQPVVKPDGGFGPGILPQDSFGEAAR